MFNLTHNNHYKHFIDGELFGVRTNKFQQYTTDVGTIDMDYYLKNDYNKERLRIAQLQYNDLGSDLVLFVSGGLDSEIMVRSYVEQGLKPLCIIIKFNGDYNSGDVNEAVDLLTELEVAYKIIDFDVKEFYHSGRAAELAREIQCELLPFLVFFDISRTLGVPTVLGGELLIEKYRIVNHAHEWVLRNFETYEAAHVRFSKIYNIPFVIEWFSYTPELMLYYLEHPRVKSIQLPTSPFLSITPVKNQILREIIPGLRKKSKGTGFENLKGLLHESKQMLGALMPENIGDSHPYLTYKEVMIKLQGTEQC
jgi:hypothetical protein